MSPGGTAAGARRDRVAVVEVAQLVADDVQIVERVLSSARTGIDQRAAIPVDVEPRRVRRLPAVLQHAPPGRVRVRYAYADVVGHDVDDQAEPVPRSASTSRRSASTPPSSGFTSGSGRPRRTRARSRAWRPAAARCRGGSRRARPGRAASSAVASRSNSGPYLHPVGRSAGGRLAAVTRSAPARCRHRSGTQKLLAGLDRPGRARRPPAGWCRSPFATSCRTRRRQRELDPLGCALKHSMRRAARGVRRAGRVRGSPSPLRNRVTARPRSLAQSSSVITRPSGVNQATSGMRRARGLPRPAGRSRTGGARNTRWPARNAIIDAGELEHRAASTSSQSTQVSS